MKHKRMSLVASVTVLGLAGWLLSDACGADAGGTRKDKPEAETAGQPPGPPDMQALMQAMGAVMSAGTNAGAVVDFRKLKALLPESLPGMKRTSATGEKTGAMGMAVATAEGTYEGAENASITIKLSDLAGTGGWGAFAQAAWASQEIDRETDTGFEKTAEYQGFKALQEYDNTGKSGGIKVLVGKSVMVEVEGTAVTMPQLEAALGKIDLKKLAAIKPVPK